MINNEYGLACCETLAILDNMNEADINKIPNNFINFLKNMANSNNYKTKFDFNLPLTELPISQKTKELLDFIYITWWCNSDEKKKYKSLINDYRITKQEQLRQQYNPNNLFAKQKESSKIEKNTNETSLVEYKSTSKINKIIGKILNFFKIKK